MSSVGPDTRVERWLNPDRLVEGGGGGRDRMSRVDEKVRH